MSEPEAYMNAVYFVGVMDGYRYQVSTADESIELQYQERFVDTWKTIDTFRIDPLCVPLIITSILELMKASCGMSIAHIVKHADDSKQVVYVDGVLVGHVTNPVHGLTVLVTNDEFSEWPLRITALNLEKQ